MNTMLQEAQTADIPFLQEMLYEAVFWRTGPDRPSFEDGLAYPEVGKSLAGWGKRTGDTGVLATIDSIPAGAAWYRYWTDDNYIRGYVDKTTPVLVIAVHRYYRRQGLGGKMIVWLLDRASEQTIPRISLSVAKDNYAFHLYTKQGFLVYADTGDSFLMLHEIKAGQETPEG